MTLPDIELDYPGEPCDDQRIREIERELNRKLPSDYAEFVKNTGGGLVSQKNCVLENVYLPSGIELDSELEQIFGNGETTNESDNDLIEEVGFLSEEWEIPEEVLLIGCTESGMHECFLINYDLPEFPKHSILYFDNESTDGYILVADSFSDFLAKLIASPDYIETEKTPHDGREGLQAARHGELSEPLKKLLAASPVPDMEKILRKAIEPLARGNCIQMYVTEDSFKFQDLLFYLAQSEENYDGLAPWNTGINDKSQLSIGDLLSYSFMTPFGWSAVTYFDAALTGWWESRTQLGVLVATPEGYKLKDAYIATVIENFR